MDLPIPRDEKEVQTVSKMATSSLIHDSKIGRLCLISKLGGLHNIAYGGKTVDENNISLLLDRLPRNIGATVER